MNKYSRLALDRVFQRTSVVAVAVVATLCERRLPGGSAASTVIDRRYSPQRFRNPWKICGLGIVTMVASLVLSCSARADLEGAFTVPPFQLNQSIIGIEGWGPRIAGGEDDGLSALVVAVRWDHDNPAVVLDSANISRAFPPTTGSKVKVTVILALTFPSLSQLQSFRIGITGAPFKEIVFDGEVGLGFGDGSGRKTAVAVPLDQLKPNSYYTISILVNYDTLTYDVDITGEKRDGTPLSYQENSVAFETKDPHLKSLFIISSRYVRAYLKELSIESL